MWASGWARLGGVHDGEQLETLCSLELLEQELMVQGGLK